MQELGHHLFLFSFFTGLIGLLWIPPLWLILSIFTPKKLLDQYFKQPHFSQTETVLMASFPGFLMRTVIFGWLVLIPSLDRKRELRGCIKVMPRWYRVALRIFIIGSMLTLIVVVGIISFLWLMMTFVD